MSRRLAAPLRPVALALAALPLAHGAFCGSPGGPAGRCRRPGLGTREIPWNRSLASVSALSAPFRARFLVLGVFSARFRQKWRRETAVAPRNRNRAQKTPSRVENDGSRRHGWSTDPQICGRVQEPFARWTEALVLWVRGGVAQPGRALRSQRRSRGFKSHHLHQENAGQADCKWRSAVQV